MSDRTDLDRIRARSLLDGVLPLATLSLLVAASPALFGHHRTEESA